MNKKPPKPRAPRVDDWEVRTDDFAGRVVTGTDFDEIVVGKGPTCWLHGERLDKRVWYFGFYGPDDKAFQLSVRLDKSGRVESVTVTNDDFEDRPAA